MPRTSVGKGWPVVAFEGGSVGFARSEQGLNERVVQYRCLDEYGSPVGDWVQLKPEQGSSAAVALCPRALVGILERCCIVFEKWVEKNSGVGDEKPETKGIERRMLTPDEVARCLQLNVQTVLKWCRTGALKTAVKVGRKWLIPWEEVDHQLRRYEVIHGKEMGGER